MSEPVDPRPLPAPAQEEPVPEPATHLSVDEKLKQVTEALEFARPYRPGG